MTDLEETVERCEERLGDLSQALSLARQYVHTDASSSLTKSRLVMERLLIDVYRREMGSDPKKPLLGEMLTNNQFTRKVERRILSRIHSIRDMGNFGPHGEAVEPSDANRVLDDLYTVIGWYHEKYQGGEAVVVRSPAPGATTAARMEKGSGVSASLKVGKVGCLLQLTLAGLLLVVSSSVIIGFVTHYADATKSEGLSSHSAQPAYSSPPDGPVLWSPPPAFVPDPDWPTDPDGPPVYVPDPDWPPVLWPPPRSPFPPDSPRFVPPPDEPPEPGRP